ncbi:hypothetical protein CcaverHIS002_0407620 [Cutaneotrichosporon cavernicola]|nr:hypothetical protein CcaverHIS002_0407620 [Cutaneotrichosporon cavernicola]
MSDIGRQSLGDKIASAVKPDSQKSTLEKAGDFVKGKADTVAAAAQPTESKSTTQKISDAVSGKKRSKQTGGVAEN